MTKYGKSSKVANAYIQNIMSLPQINNANLQKIHASLEKLLCSVQALGTMKEINVMTGRVILDKLQGVRPDLEKNDDN